jgi:hypothetical protein
LIDAQRAADMEFAGVLLIRAGTLMLRVTP